MMSPKDNNDGDDLNKKLNVVTKTIKTTQQQRKPLVTKEKCLTLELIDYMLKSTEDVKKTTKFCNNDNNLMVEPIVKNIRGTNNNNNNNNNNNDSQTSITASNETCNLIGIIINDVSKSTISGSSLGHHSKQNDKTATIKTRASGMSTNNYNYSEGGKNKKTIAVVAALDVNDDNFHKAMTTTTTIICRDNEPQKQSQQQHTQQKSDVNEQMKMTSLNEVSIESGLSSCVLVNESLVGLMNKQKRQCLSKELESAVEVREESLVMVKSTTLLQNFSRHMRHKNITIKPLSDSYQRTSDVNTLCTEVDDSQCELLELNPNVNNKQITQKDYNNQQKKQEHQIFNSLAERKALLKKEFFKDLTTVTTTNPDYLVKYTSSVEPLNKRILRKQHNLKLKIPRDCNNKPIDDPQPRVDLKLSLVALRKLDLQKKKQTNITVNKVVRNSQFPRVKELAKKFDLKNNNKNMILPTTPKDEAKSSKLEAMVERHSPLSDEGCNIGLSPYSSDDDNDSIRTTNTTIERIPNSKRKDKVARSASSDSALGLEVDESTDVTDQQQQQQQQQQRRRMTLTVTDLPLRPALLPLAEPTLLPDSPPIDMCSQTSANHLHQAQIPTKVLLEERVVEIPEDPRSGRSSRRESSQSCGGDWPAGEMQGVRFVRTPSVVVSDYSDDITCGITLEEIEYFRAQRLRRRRSSLETSGTEKDALDNNSDISASSSCSNLYYCGSTISALDGAECLVNGVRFQLERKASDCSTCSVSGDEDSTVNFTIPEQPEDCQDITDMMANQHLISKRCKKVGIATDLLKVDKSSNP